MMVVYGRRESMLSEKSINVIKNFIPGTLSTPKSEYPVSFHFARIGPHRLLTSGTPGDMEIVTNWGGTNKASNKVKG